MNNEKMEQTANRYADVIKRVKEAETQRDRATSEWKDLVESRDRLALALREFVGNNMRRKAVSTTTGEIITIEYLSDNTMPKISVYKDGDEISWQ